MAPTFWFWLLPCAAAAAAAAFAVQKAVAKNSSALLERKVEELEAALKDSQNELKATQKERAAERTGRIRAQQELRNALVGNNCENASVTAYPMTPIGTVRSCFSTRNGTPRQPLLVTMARACLELIPGGVPAEAFEGLMEYSHCWLLYVFHENTDLPRLWKKPAHSDFKAKVHVPRLDGKKAGVLATRTPHRPLPIGLTVAKIEGVHRGRLFLSGADLVDGTPVLDVKPYLPYCDAVTEARAPSFVKAGDADDIIAVQSVALTDTFKSDLVECWAIMGKYSLYSSPEELQGLLKQVLSRDIRSLNQRHKPHPAKLSVLADIVRGTSVSADDSELLSTILPSTVTEKSLRDTDGVPTPVGETDVEVLYHVLVEGINVGYTQDTEGRVVVKTATVLKPLKNTSDTKSWWNHFSS
ncbi:unnamed protein product [Calypogeia fissa]